MSDKPTKNVEANVNPDGLQSAHANNLNGRESLPSVQRQPAVAQGWSLRGTVRGYVEWVENVYYNWACTKVDCNEIAKASQGPGMGNAMQHAVISSVAAYYTFNGLPVVVGDIKEWMGGYGNRYNGTDAENSLDSKIDEYNNRIGAQIGAYAKKFKLDNLSFTCLIHNGLTRGHFIMDPSDGRLSASNMDSANYSGPSERWMSWYTADVRGVPNAKKQSGDLCP